MALDIFKLSGTVDIKLGQSEATLKRVDSSVRQVGQDLNKMADAGRVAGRSISTTARHLDQGTSSANKFSGALSNLSSKMGGLRGAGGALGSLGQMVNVAGGNILSSVLGKVTGGMTDAIRIGVNYNKMLETSAVAFEQLGMSAGQAQQHLKDLETLALKTPFEFQDIVKASISMNAFGFETRSRVDDLRKLSDAASIAAAGTGNFTEALNGTIFALGQMRAKGKISAEEMNQLAERGIPAWDILAKKVGMTKDQLMKLGEQGKLSGEAGSRLLIEGLGEFARGTGDRLSNTILGKESNVQDAYAKRAAQDTKSLTEAYRNALDEALKGFDANMGQSFTQKVGDSLASSLELVTQTLAGKISGKEFLDAFKSSGAQWWNSAMDGFKGAITGSGSSVFEAVRGWAGSVSQSVKDALGIKSPSRVFFEIGRNVLDGFNMGLEAGKRKTGPVIDAEKMRQQTLDELRKLRSDPAVRAMLDTIASAEGAGYNTLFGGGTFSDFSKHPNQAISRMLGGKAITSTAAGRYQFLNKTWDWASGQIGLKDFSPESQDLAAIWLMKRRGMLGPLGQGDVAGSLTAGNREWASLPGSPYGQPTKRAEELIGVYAAALERLTGATMAAAQSVQAFGQQLPAATSALAQVGQMSGQSSLPLLTDSMTIRAGQDLIPTIAALPAELNKLSTETTLAKGAIAAMSTGTAKGMDAVTQASEDQIKALFSVADATTKVVDHFEGLRDAIANGIDDLIGDLIEGGGRWKDTLKRMASDMFRSFLNGVFSSMTGGKAGSPGQFIGNMLGGLVGGGGGGALGGMLGGNGGGLFTGGFAGGPGAGGILGGGGPLGGLLGGGGGPLGGLLGKIPGIGKLFGGGKVGFVENALTSAFGPAKGAGAMSGALSSLGAGGLMLGGGLLGSMLGRKSPMGRLLGGVGGTLLGGVAAGSGLFGGSMAAAMPALFSNPITAIIGGALLGGALLLGLRGDPIIKSLRGLVRGEYGINVKSDKVLENVKAIGQSKYGKEFKKKQIETVRLPEVRELLSEYAARTGQKGNSKLFSLGALQDPYNSANRFVTRREHGGPLAAGQAAIVGEKRPELFIPHTAGRILPYVPGMGGGGSIGGETSGWIKMLLAAVDDLREVMGGLRGIPGDHVIVQALNKDPDIATRAVRRSLDKRTPDSMAIRDRIFTR